MSQDSIKWKPILRSNDKIMCKMLFVLLENAECLKVKIIVKLRFLRD